MGHISKLFNSKVGSFSKDIFSGSMVLKFRLHAALQLSNNTTAILIHFHAEYDPGDSGIIEIDKYCADRSLITGYSVYFN